MARQYLFAYAGGKLKAKTAVDTLTNARAIAYATVEGKDPRYKLKNGQKVDEVIILPTPNADDEGDVVTNTVRFSKKHRCMVCVNFEPFPSETTYRLYRNGKLGDVLEFFD